MPDFQIGLYDLIMRRLIWGVIAVISTQVGFASPSAIKLTQPQFYSEIQHKLHLDRSWRLKGTLKLVAGSSADSKSMSVTGYFKKDQLLLWVLEGNSIFELRIGGSAKTEVLLRKRSVEKLEWTSVPLLDGTLERYLASAVGDLFRTQKASKFRGEAVYFRKVIRLPYQNFMISPKNSDFNFKKIEFVFEETKGWQSFYTNSIEPALSLSLDIYDLSAINDSSIDWNATDSPDELFN